MNTEWVLNFDSAPFCNSSLHLGHARNYVIGDIRARWLRMQNTHCCYRTSFDAFGYPNEHAARIAGEPIDPFVNNNIRLLTNQMQRLQLSYDGPTQFRTCDPEYYRWTQWLFLKMWEERLVYRQTRPAPFCVNCNSELSSSQIINGLCWRCDLPVKTKLTTSWYVRTSLYVPDLIADICNLTRWGQRGRRVLLSQTLRSRRSGGGGLGADDQICANSCNDDNSQSDKASDWLVSRSLKWGTPIPAVDCKRCGLAPVDKSCLPVRLPVHGGSGYATCQSCGSENEPVVADTLDCFFDDAWCCFATAPNWKPGPQNPFEMWMAHPPSEVHFHTGYDASAYLPLFRFVGRFLYNFDLSPRPEAIDVYFGHDVVTKDGRKMSKRLGNAPDLNELLDTYGSDVIRLSVVINANPSKQMEWSSDRIRHAQSFLETCINLRKKFASDQLTPIDSTPTMTTELSTSIERFISEYRIAAAIDLVHIESSRLLAKSRQDPQSRCNHEDVSKASELLFWWDMFAPSNAHSEPLSKTPSELRAADQPFAITA